MRISTQFNKPSPSQVVIYPTYHWRCNILIQELSNGITSNINSQNGMVQAHYLEVTILQLSVKLLENQLTGRTICLSLGLQFMSLNR